jgi:hypothetical protein
MGRRTHNTTTITKDGGIVKGKEKKKRQGTWKKKDEGSMERSVLLYA